MCELCLFLIQKLRQMTLQAWCTWNQVGLSQPCVCHRLSLAVVSCSRLLSPGGTLLQHQDRFPMFLKPHRVSFNILKIKYNARGWWHGHAICGPNTAHRNKLTMFIQSWKNLNSRRLHSHTLRMRMKSCLSTRRKWQLSSLKMMVAARGASFSKASCPKSSPSCKVVTSPCVHTVLHYTGTQL